MTDTRERRQDLDRIRQALHLAAEVLARFRPEQIAVRRKGDGSPVTEADLAADEALRRALPVPGEGWLSEETPDDRQRLGCRRVWVVDPLDGTREFLAGLPEWCISVGLVVDGIAVAGGIYAPAVGELYLGAVGLGATLDGTSLQPRCAQGLSGAIALLGRGARAERACRQIGSSQMQVRSIGAAAYTLALVAAGRGDAHWSCGPKAEWDVAAGTALIHATGGVVTTWDGAPVRFNAWPPTIPGILACGTPALHASLRDALARAG